MQSKLFDGARWWKFDAYEVDEDYIRPASGARISSYDPWALRDRRSYLELANLATTPEDPEPDYAAITRWCDTYGPLGLLLQRTHVVRLAARWSEPDLSSARGGQQTIHSRVGGRWESDESVLVGLTVPRQALTGGEHDPRDDSAGEAVIEDIWGSRPRPEPLSLTWGRYFPSIPRDERDTYQYPLPGSRDFWNLYAEPTEQFLVGAAVLDEALAASSTEASSWSLERLNALASTARLSAIEEDGGLVQRWVAPSLIGTMGLMALLDLTGGVVPSTCSAEGCANYFIAERPWAEFCSARCRHREQKRRQRAKKKGLHDG